MNDLEHSKLGIISVGVFVVISILIVATVFLNPAEANQGLFVDKITITDSYFKNLTVLFSGPCIIAFILAAIGLVKTLIMKNRKLIFCIMGVLLNFIFLLMLLVLNKI